MDSHCVEWIITCDNHYLICWSNCPSLTTESSINLAPILFGSLDSSWDVSYFWPKRISWTLFVLYLKLAAFPRSSGFYWWRGVFRNQEVGFVCAHSQRSWEIWRDINMLMYPCPYLSLSKTLTSYCEFKFQSKFTEFSLLFPLTIFANLFNTEKSTSHYIHI